MANAFQATTKKLILDADLDFLTDTIKVSLIDLADYTYSSAHDFWNDVAAGSVVATATLASKTTTGGVFDSADPVFSAVTGDVSEALWLWRDTTVNTTSPLIAFYDTGVTGLPVTPNGGDINVVVNASGWFNI